MEKDSLSSTLGDWSPSISKDLNNQTRLVTIASNFPREYDVIVGNPPYFNLKLDEIKKKYPNENFGAVATGRTNIASLFLKKYVDSLKNDGYLGFVFPRALPHSDCLCAGRLRRL